MNEPWRSEHYIQLGVSTMGLIVGLFGSHTDSTIIICTSLIYGAIYDSKEVKHE